MANRNISRLCFSVALMCVASLTASAQSFQVQCPTTTVTHPATLHDNNSEPTYTGPTDLALNAQGFFAPTANVNGAIKCQQISGGDGFATMADGTQTYLFAFGPLSGLKDMADGKPGTQFPNVFNTATLGLKPGDPATANGIVPGTWPGFPLPTVRSHTTEPLDWLLMPMQSQVASAPRHAWMVTSTRARLWMSA